MRVDLTCYPFDLDREIVPVSIQGEEFGRVPLGTYLEERQFDTDGNAYDQPEIPIVRAVVCPRKGVAYAQYDDEMDATVSAIGVKYADEDHDAAMCRVLNDDLGISQVEMASILDYPMRASQGVENGQAVLQMINHMHTRFYPNLMFSAASLKGSLDPRPASPWPSTPAYAEAVYIGLGQTPEEAPHLDKEFRPTEWEGIFSFPIAEYLAQQFTFPFKFHDKTAPFGMLSAYQLYCGLVEGEGPGPRTVEQAKREVLGTPR